MNWMWILIIGVALFIGLKLFLKTLKLISIIAIVAVVMGAFWMWQHGMLPLK
ncbi:MAG TPA: hypothetical protein VEC37_07280 [Bacillota bacterium]|nr:hypothetical protein [Bacillota bacterium]